MRSNPTVEFEGDVDPQTRVIIGADRVDQPCERGSRAQSKVVAATREDRPSQADHGRDAIGMKSCRVDEHRGVQRTTRRADRDVSLVAFDRADVRAKGEERTCGLGGVSQ